MQTSYRMQGRVDVTQRVSALCTTSSRVSATAGL